MGWLSGWSYRKEVTLVEQSSAAYNDLPTIITAAYNAHMKSDFADCRFTESDGTTLIAYGIKAKTDEVECEFVITRDYTSGASLTVYIYYGNADAADASVDYTSWCQDWYINNGFGKNPSAYTTGTCSNFAHTESDTIPAWPEHVFGGCTANGGYRAFNGRLKINGTLSKWASTVVCFGRGNALKLRWDKYNCTIQSYDSALFVKGASNTVTWGHYSGGNTGYWVSWLPAEPSVSFGDEETPSGSADFLAKFEVGQDSADLLVRSEVGQGSEDLYARFEVGQASAELFSKAEVGQNSADLLGRFEAQVTAELLGNAEVQQSGSAELLGNAVIRKIGSAELLGKFEAQATANLLGNAEIQQSGSAELLGKFEAQATANLLGNAEIQQSGSAELLGRAVVRNVGSDELLGKVDITHSVDLLGKFEAQVPVDLLGKAEVQRSGSAELLGNAEVKNIGSADLFGRAVIRHVGTPIELPGKAEVQQSRSAELLGRAAVKNVGSAELLGKAEVKNIGSTELLSNFRVNCPKLMGGNWQRKMWFDGTYYWRGRYDPTADDLIFEYIAAAGLSGNVWTINANASIDASGFAADAYGADFTVRGSEDGIPTTIHYSDGVDTWVAESDEASLTGWAWQNLTKVFDGTAPDSYRRVNLNSNRADTPALWASAVFVDDDAGKQWVQTRKQTTSMDATAWDPAVAVSNVDNTDTIYGCSSRSMGAAGAEANDVIWVYKEGDALRSRFFTGVWQDIQDIDTSTYSGKAMFDFEHGEILGENEGHVVYVDADGTIKWRERDAGAIDTWSAAETLDTGTTNHGGVGIVEHGSGWLWVIWKEANVIQYRLHLCIPETWYPVLAGEPLTFNVASDAVVTTSTVAQPNTPDCIPIGNAVPICWIGETTPTTPCAVGWGILVPFTIASLKGIFDVRQLTSTDLYARLEVGQDSTDLLSKAVTRHVGIPVDLLGKAEIQQSASAELLSKFEVGQDSADLLSRFQVGQASVDLLARFEVGQGAEELLGRAAIRHSASSDLKFSLYVSPWYLTASEMLIGGRDRRIYLGGLDREMVVGGRNRRMRIK